MWRRLVRERDNYACQGSGPHEGGLHAHHIKQVRFFPELRATLSNGITLCEACHYKVKTEQGPRRLANQDAIAGEAWRAVVGWEGVYSVSDYWRIRRDRSANGTRAGRIMKPAIGDRGCLSVVLKGGGVRAEKRTIHSIVAAAFIGPCPEGMVINHIDADPSNNTPSNLEYVTHKGNSEHMVKLGRQASGDRNGSRVHPERLARGDRSGARLHPERIPRGERSGPTLHPESYQGEKQAQSKLKNTEIVEIRNAVGTNKEIAARYTVDLQTVWKVRRGKTWKHIPGPLPDAPHSRPDLAPRGERNGGAKITEADVIAIRAIVGMTQQRIAEQYGIDQTTVSLIRSRKKWAHVP